MRLTRIHQLGPLAPRTRIELDEDQLKRFGENFFVMGSRGLAVKTVREKGLFTALRLARKRRKRR